MNKDGSETIRVKTTTKERLENYGKFGESMDDVISRLLNKVQKNVREVVA